MKHTTMEDLDEHMLTQIFLRLDSCATALVCRAVNKHWCSLLSDRRFASHFSNHKRKRITPKLWDTRDRKRSRNITSVPWESEEPAWTFITSMLDEKQNVWRVGNASSNEAVFGSPKFSLEHLPFGFTIDATCMDLVLCSSSSEDEGRVYYITNPLTKQWVALPPAPVGYWWKPWAALICQHDPRDDYYSQDYKFRVVLVKKEPPDYFTFRKQVVVYCSEIGEWKKIDVNVTSSKKGNPEIGNSSYKFLVVVCNGVIYLNHYLGLAAFNPLDVDQTTTDIEAKLLPSLPVAGDFLKECSGQLFVIHNESTSYNKYEGTIKFPLMVWKMDPNQVPHIWKLSFQGTCTGTGTGTGNVNQTKRDDGWQICAVWHLGMHPNNDRLLFMYLYQEKQIFLCNTRSRSIEPLKTLSGYGPSVMQLQRLELQWWPTLVPRPYLSNVSH